MSFPHIAYMEWAKTAGAGCEIFLSRSGAAVPPAEWLGTIDLAEALRYPEAYGDPPLLDAIARQYGAQPSQVLMAQGTSEANFLIYAALLEPGDLVAVETPVYEPLVRNVQALGAKVLPLERSRENGYQPLLKDVEAALAQGARLIVLTDLHNPSGVALDSDLRLEIVARIDAANAWLLVDEVYLDFRLEQRPESAFRLSPRVITTSSLTKVYGLGSLRCGWALGPEALIQKAYRVRDHLGVVAAGPAVLHSRAAFSILDRLLAWSAWRAAAGRAVVDHFLSRQEHLRWVPPSAGIMGLLELPEGVSGWQVSATLAETERVLVTPGEFFGAPGTVRVCFGGEPDDVEAGLRRLQRCVEEVFVR